MNDATENGVSAEDRHVAKCAKEIREAFSKVPDAVLVQANARLDNMIPAIRSISSLAILAEDSSDSQQTYELFVAIQELARSMSDELAHMAAHLLGNTCGAPGQPWQQH